MNKLILLLIVLLTHSVAEARPLRFIQKLVPSNYQLYQNNAIGDGQVTWKIDFQPPPNIVSNYVAWIKWKDYRIAQFEKMAPKERGNTYYFTTEILSEGGSDSNDCSVGAPCLTRAKCLTLIAANNGNTRCRFAAGGEWIENDDFTTATNNNTIDCFDPLYVNDVTACAASKPLHNAFTVKYTSGVTTWTPVSGNVYSTPEAQDIAWVRPQDDRLGETRAMLSEQNSTVNVGGVSNSYFIDTAADLLYVNLAGDDPNDENLEAALSVASSGVAQHGIRFQGHGNRVENIRFDGYGISRTEAASDSNGITMAGTGTEFNYVKDSESYFGSNHTVQHNTTSVGHRGGSMFNGLRSGYTRMVDASSESMFAGYGGNGGHEIWLVDILGAYGTLPSYRWSFATLGERGAGAVIHGGTIEPVKLSVIYNWENENTRYPVASIGGNNDPVLIGDADRDDFTKYRSFKVNCRQPVFTNMATPAYAARFETSKESQIHYGGTYAYRMIQNTTGSTAPQASHSWVINTSIIEDMTTHGASGTFISLYNNAIASGNKLHFLHVWHELQNVSITSNRWSYDFDARTNSNDSSADSLNINSAFVFSKTATGYLARKNAVDRLFHNAFRNVTQDAGNIRGYDLDAGDVTLSTQPTYGVEHSELKNAGYASKWRASHDINGRRRTDNQPDIGAVEY